jgi:lipopolysaccharide biosynthesis regulator YciM
VDRADLDDDKRQQAIFELAQDYLKAGILDRAESLFRELGKTKYAKPALEFLLALFQKEHDWLKAISIAERLTEQTGESYSKQAAFFYCELAAEEITIGDSVAAREHLQQALHEHPHSVRATMMLGDLYASEKKFAEAIAMWKTIEQQDEQYLPLVAERMLNAYRSLDHESDGVALLRSA